MNRKMNDYSNYLQVGVPMYTIVGWISFVFLMVCAMSSFVAHQYWPIAIFCSLAILSAYLIIGAGRYYLNDNEIIHHNFYKVCRIRWSEVKKIELGINNGAIVFYGINKRFVIAPPSMWSGAQKQEAFSLLVKKVNETGITPCPSDTAAYKINKNVCDKVKRFIR